MKAILDIPATKVAYRSHNSPEPTEHTYRLAVPHTMSRRTSVHHAQAWHLSARCAALSQIHYFRHRHMLLSHYATHSTLAYLITKPAADPLAHLSTFLRFPWLHARGTRFSSRQFPAFPVATLNSAVESNTHSVPLDFRPFALVRWFSRRISIRPAFGIWRSSKLLNAEQAARSRERDSMERNAQCTMTTSLL